MIISASYRTDIPAFYAAWLQARLAPGWCRVVNLYGGASAHVDLMSDDGFVFWTRNVELFLATLRVLHPHWPFVVQYTLTGYLHALETSVVPVERAITTSQPMGQAFGPRKIVGRYDQILFTILTLLDLYVYIFACLCTVLSGVVDEVVISFTYVYRKIIRNLTAAAIWYGFRWEGPAEADKYTPLRQPVAFAVDYDLTLPLCGQASLREASVAEARCIDTCHLSDAAGRSLPGLNRISCTAAIRYVTSVLTDTCPHGCMYCYAVSISLVRLSRPGCSRSYQSAS